ncbi:MAG: phenylalanine--tRNA ligase subunit alpha [Chloroflexota bacterium]|nr:phenylalanine--tRNA ligase subunit alpha [Chloroflexota bacterium]
MLEELTVLREEAIESLAAADDAAALEAWRVEYLGRKGSVTGLMRNIGKLPGEDRPAYGQAANQLKVELSAAYEKQKQAVAERSLVSELATEGIDVTLPGRRPQIGRYHPSIQTLREIYEIFAAMGFQVFTSRDVETDECNFELLNMPPGHPARDMWDTFHTTQPGIILRTHTSPGQIHAMQALGPDKPIRVILPGLCYRYEQVTARAEMMFHQVEGLVVGRHITMADLKGVIVEFANQVYGEGRKLRFRCSHFPFTEPSVEADVDCILCEGKGCGVCKYTGWLEIMGAGMVHPVVLENGGYDPKQWSGFAFGMGPERIAMLKHGISDIRYFFGNDLRFLKQF